jgi:hypothetical protein
MQYIIEIFGSIITYGDLYRYNPIGKPRKIRGY